MSPLSKPVSAIGSYGHATLLDRMFEHVPVGLALLERGAVVRVNPAFAALLGVPAAQLEGQSLPTLFGAEWPLAILPELGSTVVEARVAHGSAPGSLLSLQVTALDECGAHVVTARDVTSERNHERELRESREFLRTVIDTVPGFVFVKDCDSRFLLANKSIAAAYGTTVDELTGKCDADFNDDREEIEHFKRDDRDVMGSRKPKLILCEKVTYASGEVRYLTTVKVPIVDKADHCSSLLAVATDITELKRSQEMQARLHERIVEAQKLESLGVLAGGIAHDFNNLLLAILGSAEAALVQARTSSALYGSVQRIRTAALRAAELTNQLLAYSGKGQFVVQTVDLNAVARDMAELLELSLAQRAGLRFEFAAGLPGVTADVAQLRQVIMNLITNAVDAMHECGGTVTLQTGLREVAEGELEGPEGALEAGDYVFVRVRDTGSGMDELTVAKMFDPFFTTKFAGRGLGLAAVLGIVRAHRGSIDVDSSVGQGSTITVYLPASDQPPRVASRRAPQTSPAASQGAYTVLVVDDEELICFTTRHLLELCGYRVLTASGGEQALRLVDTGNERVDAVLLDLTMPTMPADQVIVELRRRRPHAKVILMSGYDEQDIRARLSGIALAAFLQKPFTLDQLNTALSAVLEPAGVDS